MKKGKTKVLYSSFGILTIVTVFFLMVAFANPVTAQPPKPIELAYTLHTPAPPAPPAKATADQASVEWFAKEVEAKTAGRVKIKFYYGGVLGKPSDFLRMVGGGGVAQLGNVIGYYHQWEVPLFAGALLSFLTTDLDIEGRALTKLYNEWAPMREEWAKHNVKPLWWYIVDPYWLACKKEISKLDDLRGQKISGFGGFGEIINKFGITQVAVPATEAYDALQKGSLDGLIFPYSPIKTFKYYEPCRVLVDLSFCGGQTPNAQVINLDAWKKISPADQKAIEGISANMHDWFVKYYQENEKRITDFYKKEGVKLLALSPQEQKRVKDTCAEGIWATWVAKCKEKGVPGEEFLKRYRAILSKLTKK
jgi:TRAP-type C4-dicarboxylate transport system substrate-binding protein